MEYTKTTLAVDDVLILLQKCDNEFSPALSSTIDLEQYSQKLSKFAQFILAIEKGQIAGFVAYYLNDDEHFIYIPLIWVSSLYQKSGIGTQLIARLSQLQLLGYADIRLEVLKSNENAILFYQKESFTIHEDRGCKYLLTKLL